MQESWHQLGRLEAEEQLTRKMKGLLNLTLTDYLEFSWHFDGGLRETTGVGRIDGQGRIAADTDDTRNTRALIEPFLTHDAPTVADPREVPPRLSCCGMASEESLKKKAVRGRCAKC